jgi:non-specific serine/threonine protein kinase
LALAREVGRWHALGWALYVLASVLWFERHADGPGGIDLLPSAPDSNPDEDAHAISLLEESLAIYRQHGDARHMAIVLAGGGSLGAWYSSRGEYALAERAFVEGLALHYHVGALREVADALRRLSLTACGQDQHRRAARLFGASDAAYEATKTRPLPMFQDMIDRSDATIRARIDAATFSAGWDQGRTLTLEQAVAYALRREDPFADDPLGTAADAPSSAAPRARDPAALTPREREVAILVGRGYSNRRIAEELVIAEKTAEVHARNVREKLGLASRAQIAAWAARHGLLEGEQG